MLFQRTDLFFIVCCFSLGALPALGAPADNQWPELGAGSPTAQIQRAPVQPQPQPQILAPPPAAQLAPAAAPQPRKYHFLFVHREQTPETDAMWNVFQTTMGKIPDRAQWQAVNLLDPASAPIVQQFQLQEATTPLALSIAPNGAVMGVFPGVCTEQQLLGTFGTPGQEAAQLALLQGKMVIVCAQNERTLQNREALSGVQALLQDFRFTNYASAVQVNPADPTEAVFLQQLQIDPRTDTALTVIMTPPGYPVATLAGATTKDGLIGVLKNKGGCGPNCQCLEAVPEKGDSKPVLSKFFNKIAGGFGK